MTRVEVFSERLRQKSLDLNSRPPFCFALDSLVSGSHKTMDDLLEPSASTSISHSDPEKVEDAEMSSGDEDEGLDWTKLLP